MSKISKLLVMALVVLAVITMSVKVNAGTSDLSAYVTTNHNINGMIFELSNDDKVKVRDYLAAYVTDAQADTAYAKITEAQNLVASTGATSLSAISADVKAQVISLAKESATAVGLTLDVNTQSNVYSLYYTNVDGQKVVLSSRNVEKLVTTVAAASTASSASTSTATTGSTLLYTGANYAVYAVVALAIVAVAVIVKKRA